MAPAPFVLFVGDLHAGSRQALRPDPQDRAQAALLAHWKTMTVRAKQEAKGREFWLMLGGDMIEGFHHDNAEHHGGTREEQRAWAVELLRPLAAAAAQLRAITGTEAHGGHLGEDDRAVARELGVKPEKIDTCLSEAIGGRRLWWWHQGPAPGRNARTFLNPLLTLIQDVRIDCALKHTAPPALMVWHHVHRSAQIDADGITAAICPCWQRQTYWAGQKFALGRPDLGVLAWWPDTNNVEPWLYGA